MLLSQNFIGIRCGNKLNAAFLKVYLESPIGKFLLTNKLSGTAIPTLRRRDIELLEIPNVPFEKQKEMMNEYLQKENFIEKEIAKLKQELADAKKKTFNEMGISGIY